MDFDSAVAAHMQWKIKLRAAIADKSQLDAASISRDNICPVGQWLHGEARQRYGHLTSHASCVTAHAAFHKEAGRVAHLINQKKYAEAENALANGTPYIIASSDVGVALNRLRRETA